MKKLIVIACALLALSATASAQFMNSGASTSTSKNSGAAAWISNDHADVFNTFSFTYSPMNIDGWSGNIEDDGLNALSLTWTQARNVMASQPLYVEYGVGAQWSFWSDSESDGDMEVSSSLNFLSLKVPVSVMYLVSVPNTQITLAPYLGLNLTGYLLGQQKISMEYEGESESRSSSCFSKDDMGGEPYNRFGLGWHIGARVGFGKYFFNIGYEGPITNLYKSGSYEVSTNQVNISLGLTF